MRRLFHFIQMPKSSAFRILTGEALVAVLAVTSVSVKWFRRGSPTHVIPPSMAACIAKAGQYEGKVKKGRVYFIREIDGRPAPVFDASFRDGESCLRWWADETSSVNPKEYRKRIADAWDRIAASDPPPRRFAPSSIA